MQQINLPAPQSPPIPDFTIGADLDGASYTLRFTWNSSDSYWYVRVLDDPGQRVLLGDTRVVIGPLYESQTSRTPPGLLIGWDTTGQGIAPALAELGGRVQVYYIPEADLAVAAPGL